MGRKVGEQRWFTVKYSLVQLASLLAVSGRDRSGVTSVHVLVVTMPFHRQREYPLRRDMNGTIFTQHY